MPGGTSSGGTGSHLTKATVIVCGLASLVASLISFLYVGVSSDEPGEIQLTLLDCQVNMASDVYPHDTS